MMKKIFSLVVLTLLFAGEMCMLQMHMPIAAASGNDVVTFRQASQHSSDTCCKSSSRLESQHRIVQIPAVLAGDHLLACPVATGACGQITSRSHEKLSQHILSLVAFRPQATFLRSIVKRE